MLFSALNAYDQYAGVSGSSKEARKALDASQKFMAIKSLRGLEIRFRSDVTGHILRKTAVMNILRGVFKSFDWATDQVTNFRNFIWQRRNTVSQGLTFEYISSIDDQTGRFIKQHYGHDLTRKEKSDLSWIMNSPWILSAPLKDSVSKRYYFSSRAGRFLYLGVKVFDNQGEMIGFFLLKVRDDRMSVLYSYCDSRDAASITAAVFHQERAMGVRTLSLFDEQLIAGFSALGFPCWSTKKKSRGFSLSKAFADIPLSNYRLNGGDGDLAFF